MLGDDGGSAIESVQWETNLFGCFHALGPIRSGVWLIDHGHTGDLIREQIPTCGPEPSSDLTVTLTQSSPGGSSDPAQADAPASLYGDLVLPTGPSQVVAQDGPYVKVSTGGWSPFNGLPTTFKISINSAAPQTYPCLQIRTSCYLDFNDPSMI